MTVFFFLTTWLFLTVSGLWHRKNRRLQKRLDSAHASLAIVTKERDGLRTERAVWLDMRRRQLPAHQQPFVWHQVNTSERVN